MRSTSGRSWSRRARAVLLVGIVWAEPWDPERAFADTPPAGAPAPLLALPTPKRLSPNQGEYVLRRAPGGGYLFEDFRFTAHVAPDGHVNFRDKHIRFETRVFGVLAEKYRRAGDDRPSLIQALEQVIRKDPDRPISPMVEVCQQRVDMLLPGMAACTLVATPITIVGTWDLTDELMNLTGQGWYRYEKAKFLSATFDFRVRLAAERHAKLLREALTDLPDRLEALWRDTGFTPREKRRIMCLLWAEVDVDQTESRKAADVISGWVRRKIPAGSTYAYTGPELEACSEHARRPFAPYAPE
jgi:hypothetical protein